MSNVQENSEILEIFENASKYVENGVCNETVMFQVFNGFGNRRESGTITVIANATNWKNTVLNLLQFETIGSIRIDVQFRKGSESATILLDYSNKRDFEKLFEHSKIECPDDDVCSVEGKKPMMIEIVFSNHVYTATVYDLKCLERFCSDMVRVFRAFRFGSIVSYGSVDLNSLCQVMNRIRHFGTYDRYLERPANA